MTLSSFLGSEHLVSKNATAKKTRRRPKADDSQLKSAEMSARESLKNWIAKVSDPNRDPWPKLHEVDDTMVKFGPPSNEAKVVDPTADFKATRPDQGDFTYKGGLDDDGRFHDGGTVYFDNGDCLMCDFEHGKRRGDAVIISKRSDITRLCGVYVDGALNGRGRLITTNTSATEGFLFNGVFHGLVRRIDMKKFREFRRQLGFVGRFRDGRPFGPCWEYREGGGFIYGIPDEEGNFTGPEIAFVFPDLETAFLGEFLDGQMMSAVEAKVASVRLVDEIMEAEFEILGTEKVSFSQSTKTSLGSNLLVADPYEAKHVQCGVSSVNGGGEGLFALKDIPVDTIVAFYNGVRLPYVLGGPKEDWSTSGYKIFVNADYTSGLRMDIPADFVHLNRYKATMGHKMNHSFAPNCVEWFAYHPRFGLIPCEKTLRAIKAGEELFLDYEYDPYNCPDWFEPALRNFVKCADDEAKENIARRYHKFIELECGEENRNED